MKMPSFSACFFVLALAIQSWALESVESSSAHHRHHHKGKHHHHHKGHHHHHGKHHNASSAKVEHPSSATAVKVTPAAASKKVVAKPAAAKAAAATKASAVKVTRDEQLVQKMKELEVRLAQKKKSYAAAMEKGHILVSGPVPADFKELFAQAVGAALNVDAKKVTVTKTAPVADQPGVVSVDFKASPKVVSAVESQSADPDSKLARGNLHSFLVAKGDDDEEAPAEPKPVKEEEAVEATPVQEKGIDIDTAMPYGDLEPFGREDTAQELTENSVQESDEMVDQLERAEVAEEKRAVFRALTRLRGAAITSFDGVARSQTGNIDEYNKIHKWRSSHPLHHLADEESDISKWAFPDNAD